MFGTILNSNLCSVSGNKFEMEAMWQAYFIMNTYTVWTLANFNEMDRILLFRKWCITFSLRTSMLKACIFPKSLTIWGGIFKSINCEFFSCIWWFKYQTGRKSRSYLPSLKLTFAHTIYDQGIKNAMTQYPCCPVLPHKHALYILFMESTFGFLFSALAHHLNIN